MNLHCDEQIMVDSFPGALSQIITNLVMNALIHGFENRDKGEITLRMWETQAHIHIEFTDNGKGMDQATVRKVFDPFFTTKRAAGGTGLGLHIVYNIVTGRLKGNISCTSFPGEGATFLIRFPH
jgi:signal transduction histidine kinase